MSNLLQFMEVFRSSPRVLMPGEHLACYVMAQVTSYKMAMAMESEVVGGPTAQGQPAFEWGSKWDGFAHRGMPDR